MSEADAWDPGSSPKPRADAGTPGASSADGIGPDRRVRHAGGSRRIRLHDRSTTTSTVPRNRIPHPRLITRFTAVVTALAGAVPAFGAAAPAAFALYRRRNQAALATPLRSWSARDRRRHARREDHSDRSCGSGPRRSRGSAGSGGRGNARAHFQRVAWETGRWPTRA